MCVRARACVRLRVCVYVSFSGKLLAAVSVVDMSFSGKLLAAVSVVDMSFSGKLIVAVSVVDMSFSGKLLAAVSVVDILPFNHFSNDTRSVCGTPFHSVFPQRQAIRRETPYLTIHVAYHDQCRQRLTSNQTTLRTFFTIHKHGYPTHILYNTKIRLPYVHSLHTKIRLPYVHSLQCKNTATLRTFFTMQKYGYSIIYTNKCSPLLSL